MSAHEYSRPPRCPLPAHRGRLHVSELRGTGRAFPATRACCARPRPARIERAAVGPTRGIGRADSDIAPTRSSAPRAALTERRSRTLEERSWTLVSDAAAADHIARRVEMCQRRFLRADRLDVSQWSRWRNTDRLTSRVWSCPSAQPSALTSHSEQLAGLRRWRHDRVEAATVRVRLDESPNRTP